MIADSAVCENATKLRIIGGDLSAEAIPHLARFTRLDALEGGLAMTARQCVELLRAVPQLRYFGAFHNTIRVCGQQLATLLEAPETQRLAGLDLWANELTDDDLARIAATPFAHLERLGVGHGSWTAAGLAALAASPHLHGLVELDIYYNQETTPHSPAAFCAPPFALRRLRYSPVDASTVPILEQSPLLDWIVIDNDSEHIPRLRETIPWVNDAYSL